MSVIESTIDGRYQVIGRIASGGMGEVYRAHDAVLDREVALKVLHPQLAGDRGFVDRFRREARAAALLNHPNIVGVYDWGSTDGTYFMIMEFVRGHNLRALMLEYGRLEPAQVVEIASQVLLALEQAHGHGIVHRDIKPENILIAGDGTVKVADFGLARAFADSYVSQAEGTVTGTVQYLAPEQIHGEPADPRTDLYALGVVMFEMLTGQTPFSGETSVAIAYKHLSERVPPPSSLSPAVPLALDQAVLHATEKDRDERPASARALLAEIARTAPGLSPATTVADLAAQIPSTELVPEDRAATVTIPRSRSPKAARNRRLKIAALIVGAFMLLAAGAWAAWEYLIPHYTNVPGVGGLGVPEATGRLEEAGLKVVLGDAAFSSTVPAGSVVTTRPPPGTRIEQGQTVTLIPSKGPELVAVPVVTGRTQDAAVRLLRAAGFETTQRSAYDEKVPKGQVVSQNPEAGTKIERGSAVNLTISLGPPPVTIPDVSGQPADTAASTLESLGLRIARQEEFSDEVERGNVIRTVPGALSEIPKGSEVTLVVSKGPETFELPSVVGMSEAEATATLEGLGLVVRPFPLPTGGDEVVYQSPEAGTLVQEGDQVTIFLGGL